MDTQTAQTELGHMIRSLEIVLDSYKAHPELLPSDRRVSIDNVQHRLDVLRYCLNMLKIQQIELA